MWKTTETHHIQLSPAEGHEEMDFPTGTVIFSHTKHGYDKYQKGVIQVDGTKSDGTFQETKQYHGTFGLTTNANMFDLQLILVEDATGEEHNVLYKCTHHPISNKQWPAIDNPEAGNAEEHAFDRDERHL